MTQTLETIELVDKQNQNIKEDLIEEAVVEIWEDFTLLKKKLHIIVLSDEGWSWLLAWLQIGMKEVTCIPISSGAEQQLENLITFSPIGAKVYCANNPTSVEPSKDKITIVCANIHHLASLDRYLAFAVAIKQTEDVQWCLTALSVTANQNILDSVKKKVGASYVWQTLRHSALGGLTTARLHLGWNSNLKTFSPGARNYPRRPLDRFLDVPVRLAPWRKVKPEQNLCWRPAREEATPYPWPWATGPRWVEASSVYLKEEVQLWNEGRASPLRLFVEFIAATRAVLAEKIVEEFGWKDSTGFVEEHFDWGRVRAPWLGNKVYDGSLDNFERIAYFGWVWDAADLFDITIACKGDDADIDLKLWAVGGDTPELEDARSVLRKWLWTIWLRRTTREAIRWLNSSDASEEEKLKDKIAVIDCIRRCAQSDWWNWEGGSRLMFWRWPTLWRKEARDGSLGFHLKYPRPQLRFPQVPIAEQWIIDKDKEKLEKLLRRGYIVDGVCRTTVPRFPVPKGSDDIRVVWDLSKNGLNETMYTPTFFLATMSTYLRRIDSGFYGGDFDVGEQFHNYILHESVQPYCGVEIPDNLRNDLAKEGLSISKYMRWSRLVFGWQSSPYMALWMFARAIELAKGSPTDLDSAFNWNRVVLNLPGSTGYDPSKPRVMKIDSNDNIAADLVTFYDDGRVFACNEAAATKALRQITSRIQYLGNQDAARKRRAVSQRPGAWAGGVAYSDQQTLRKFISQEKWDKAKEFLSWVWDRLHEEGGGMDRARFRSGKGFLVHVSLCYDFMLPYMKGFHLSEEAWRTNRDFEGWKLDKCQTPPKITSEVNDDNQESLLFALDEIDDYEIIPLNAADAPPIVQPVPRLLEDVRILRMFFAHSSPMQVIVRPVEGAAFVAYGGGDASGEGFGGKIQPLGMKPLLRRGFWCLGDSLESSNWRELRNLVDTIKEEVSLGRLVGKEVWMATDNSTAANAFYRGSSSSKTLHKMITELRLLTLEGNFILHLFHIAGTRMIQSGIDALSRGEIHFAALEQSLQTLIPLHLSPITRSPSLISWLKTWLDSDFKICEPCDWFYNAHQAGELSLPVTSKTWVWDLPPAAAIHAIEELGTARLKRHDIIRGVVIVPTLLTHEWFRRLGIGSESLLWYHSEARCRRCTKKVTHRSGIFCANFGNQAAGLIYCQNAWCPTCFKVLPGETFLVYRAVDDDGEELCAPGEEKDFLEGRSGDHLFCPFECDFCAFYRLKGREPLDSDLTDKRLLIYIRRANLDAFWSRRPGTVIGMNRLFAEQVEVGEAFGFNMFPPLGPFGRSYDSGMKAAIGILARSQRPGMHEAKMKYSAVRKARSLHTNIYNASAQGIQGTLVWRSDRARFVATEAPTDSAWFNAFMTGFRARVGERRKQDAAIPIAVMVALQNSLEDDWIDAMTMNEKSSLRRIAEHGAFYLFLYCGSLRGFEGSKIVLTFLRNQIAPPGSKAAELYGAHIALPLVGRFKARAQDTRNIVIPIAYETASKLKPGLWTERLVNCLSEEGITSGWAFQDMNGEQLKMSHFEEDFYERLQQIQQSQPELFSDGINILEDFHLARSFRRGATTRATAVGVSASDIDWINRWNIGADASGSGPMRVLYSDRKQLTNLFLRFSLAL